MRICWPRSSDVVLAAAMAVVAETELRIYDQPIHAGTVSIGADSLLTLVPLVALAWRRAWPFPAAVWLPILATAVGLAGGTVCFFSTMLAFVLLVHAAAAWARSPWDVVALGVPVLLLAPMPPYDDTVGADDWAFGLVVGGAAWAAGQAARRWRHQSERLAAALAEAEAGRDAQAGLAVAEERARIARELHDVVAHGMSVMVMQAGAARPSVHDDPDQAAVALERIEDVGRTAMLEMRRLLGILRADDPGATRPQPRLAGLPALVDKLAGAGLAVRLDVEGEPHALPDAQDVSAYRIIQEALTNALRHGSGSRADVTLAWDDDRLRIRVSNPVRPGAVNGVGNGHGLVGIRERVALFGGTFSARVEDGSFVIVAELPDDREPA